MSNLKTEILKTFGNKLRIRVCSLWIQDNKLLLIKHKALASQEGDWWAPPGGGMELGETAEQTLVRELQEESGVLATDYEFAFIHEFLDPPLHAIELFFIVHQVQGSVLLGNDPEMPIHMQMLEELCFMSVEEINSLPDECKHHVLVGLTDFNDLTQKRGYSIFNPQAI
jgi:8-oxo-dGTP diphosphatase